MSENAEENSLKGSSRGMRVTNPGEQTQSGLRYRPIIALGQGGMADVLLSVGRGPGGFNKLVVLKTMRKELCTDAELRHMFLAEARLSARLNNANVIQVHEVVDTALPCIIMEYLEGQPMSALQRDALERFTLPLQLKVLSETLAGLHYSHELEDYDGTPLNIVHRDISPQNVFITYGGVVKVLDFGIAKASNTVGQTRTGVINGKISYMPREQLLNEQVDRRADVYAVGCMLWHAAAGEKLWANAPEGEVMRALIDGRIPKPSEKRPVHPSLESIVMKALAPDAVNRYATAMELRLAIDEFLDEHSPKTSMHQVGELISDVFAEQKKARKQQIHLALTAPFSDTPPPIPDGIQEIILAASDHAGQSQVTERRRQLIWVLGAAALAAVLVVSGIVTGSWRNSHANPAAAPGVAGAAKIEIRLTATPAGATLALDGNPLSGNPAVLTVHPDSQNHEVRATLDGHEPYQETLRFDHDLSREIMLRPLSKIAESAGTTSPKETATAPRVNPVNSSRSPVVSRKQSKPNCEPPFYFENGIKVYKPACL